MRRRIHATRVAAGSATARRQRNFSIAAAVYADGAMANLVPGDDAQAFRGEGRVSELDAALKAADWVVSQFDCLLSRLRERTEVRETRDGVRCSRKAEWQ
jgi:hypothetical protein